MSSDQGDGGERGEQDENQTEGQGGGQPQQGAPQDPGQGQPANGQPPAEGPADGQPPAEEPAQGQPVQGQPAGGPGQPAGGQGQPAGGQGAPPAGGQQPVRRGPSASQRVQAAFGDYAVQNQIKAILGTYGLLGVGIGFTVLLVDPLQGIGLGAGPSSMVTVGFVLAALLGLSLSTTLPTDLMEGAVVSGVTNYVGVFAMSLVAFLLASAQSTGVVPIGEVFLGLLVAGIPVGMTAGLVTALGRKVDYPATREEAEAQEPPARPAPREQPQQPQQPQ